MVSNISLHAATKSLYLKNWKAQNQIWFIKITTSLFHQIFFFAFQHFHDNISVEHDEKPSHTKFDMNWFMVARDMAAWIPN